MTPKKGIGEQQAAPKARRKRYYSDNDEEIGVTASQLKKFGKARQLEYITHWFHRNFEDPAQRTPYESAEGGYIYIWGGPYDAHEQIGDEFGDLVADATIEEAVRIVQQDGTYDWAPGRHHPDRQSDAEEWFSEPTDALQPDLEALVMALEGGSRPRFGDDIDNELRSALVARLSKLAEALSVRPPKHGGIGHNNPPEPIAATEEKALEDVRSATQVMITELAKTTPDALVVGKRALWLRDFGKALSRKVDTATDAGAKGFGDTLGKGLGALAVTGIGAVALEMYPRLNQMITDVAAAAATWLEHVLRLF